MTHSRPFLPLLVAFVLAVSGPASAQPTPTAVSAWIAEPAAGATGASAYVEMNNPTMYDVFVVSAKAESVAAKVEFRAGLAPGGTPAPATEITVPAYGSTAAAASAPHLRLVDLKRPLVAGEMIELVLTTDGGVVMKVTAPVRKP